MGILYSKKKGDDVNKINTERINRIIAANIISGNARDMDFTTRDTDYCLRLKRLVETIMLNNLTPDEKLELYKNITSDKKATEIKLEDVDVCKELALFYVQVASVFNAVKKTFLLHLSKDRLLLDDVCQNRKQRIENVAKLSKASLKQTYSELYKVYDLPSLDELKAIYQNKEIPTKLKELIALVESSNIKLRDIPKTSEINCHVKTDVFKVSLDKIETTISNSQTKLLYELDRIFKITDTDVSIRTDLTKQTLQEITENIGEELTNMYFDCETTFRQILINS
jgi:hypothetical protein